MVINPAFRLDDSRKAANRVAQRRTIVQTPVSVEKVPQLMLVAVEGSGYKQARVLDAAVYLYSWRPLRMMGHQARGESLFYYFRLEDQVPENHLLRLIDRHVNFEFVRAKLKEAYSDTGRPSIDPERLLRMLLVGYLYGVTSEKETCRRVAPAGPSTLNRPHPPHS